MPPITDEAVHPYFKRGNLKKLTAVGITGVVMTGSLITRKQIIFYKNSTKNICVTI